MPPRFSFNTDLTSSVNAPLDYIFLSISVCVSVFFLARFTQLAKFVFEMAKIMSIFFGFIVARFQ